MSEPSVSGQAAERGLVAPHGFRANGWTLAALAVSLPFVAVLCTILWHTPVPLTEAVAIFEDLV